MPAYSSTQLAKKLGIKNGFKIRLINEPDYYFNLFSNLPTDIKILTDKKSKKNFIHLFVKTLNEFEKHIHE